MSAAQSNQAQGASGQHTKWIVDDVEGAIAIASESDGEVLAYLAKPHQQTNARSAKEMAAVAHLMAAAPELLEAARNTLAYYAGTQPERKCLSDELNPCGGLKHWGVGIGCPLCSARAAIAAATQGGAK